MRRSPLLLVVLVASCGARTKVPAVEYEAQGPGCDAGNWIPGSQEPSQYLTCAADADCVKMSMPGCCSVTFVAIRADRRCGTDLGSQCDQECAESATRPADGPYLRAACVANKCALVE